MRIHFYQRFRLISLYLLSLLLSVAASRVEAQTDSLIFRDDFDRDLLGTFWQGGATWSIAGGAAYNFIDGIGGVLRTAEGYAQTSYILETSAKGFTANHFRDFRITFGQADISGSALYQLRYTSYMDGRLILSRSTDNIYTPLVLDEAAIFPNFNDFDWYTFKIVKYQSGLIQVYVDQGSGYGATPLLEAVDQSYAELGHVGWQIDTQSFAEGFYVDWISAAKPGIEKPAIKEKPVEDDLIVQVSAKSGKPYTVSKLAPGVKQLIDRDYEITFVPEYLTGASFIQAANDDKEDVSDSFLSFFVKKSAIVYVGYDSRSTSLPQWLSSWTNTGDTIGTNDSSDVHLVVYSKLVQGFGQVYPFPLILGGNLGGGGDGAKTNYLVAAVELPGAINLQAEDALLSGPVVSNAHSNYNGTGYADFVTRSNEYIEWTVQVAVPGSYNLNFKFANASDVERFLDITDNEIYIGSVSFPFISTSWSSWAFLNVPQVFLSAGTHKIRLTATGTSGPNIDELNVYFISPSAAPAVAPVSFSRDPLQEPLMASAVQACRVYPNPFAQHTNIYYTLKKKSNVNLAVYTLQGQRIQVLQNGVREAGNYQATFDAARLAKGVYFYRLQTGNEVKTGKLIKE